MGLRELRTLAAVADRGSITAAADTLFLSVPTISSHIASLEEEFRCEIMDRERKPARLNATGRRLAAHAVTVLQAYDQLHETVSDAGDLSGTLTIGTSPTVLTRRIPRAVLALRSAHPRLHIRVRYGHPLYFLDQLRRGEIDAAVMSEQRTDLSRVKWRKFVRETIMVIAPGAAKGRTDVALLREFPYIRFGRRFLVSQDIEAHLRQRGIELKETMEVESIDAIKLMVQSGVGMSIIPESNAELTQSYGLRSVALGKPAMKRDIGLACMQESSRHDLIDAFLEALKNDDASDVGAVQKARKGA